MPVLAATAPAPRPLDASASPDGYVPGVCNIGPYEIARRRRAGLTGIGIAVALAIVLLVLDVPQLARAIVLLPLWGGFVSYLQAVRRFCVGFALIGMANFGPDEAARRRVVDEDARAADRRKVRRLVAEGLLYAAPLTALYVLLPA
jgi:hypothetical protein